MYLKFNKEHITGAQLKAIAAILDIPVEDLEWFYNVHYEVCKVEVEYAIENELTIEEILEARNHLEFEGLIDKFTDELYYRTNVILDELYENAANVVNIDEVINKCELK